MILFVPILLASLAQSPTVALNGIVLSHSGQPMAGALVVLARGVGFGEPPIVAVGRTNEQGIFSLDRPAKFSGRPRYIPPRLWVAVPGYQFASVAYPEALPTPDDRVQFVLQPSAKANFHVETSEGAPVVGAKIRITRVRSGQGIHLPDEVVQLTEARTDAKGMATLGAFASDEILSIEVDADKFGIQPREFLRASTGPRKVILQPTASLSGRLMVEEPIDFKGWKVSAFTHSDAEPGGNPSLRGRAVSQVDPQGRFHFNDIAEGKLHFYVDWPDESPLIPSFPANLPPVVAGRTNVVDLNLKRSATVNGSIIEKGQGTSVAGVVVSLNRPGEGSSTYATTDSQGHFAFQSLAGKASLWLMDIPKTYVDSGVHRDIQINIPVSPGRIILTPIELTKAAAPLLGEVHDESGGMVIGATVTGQWGVHEKDKFMNGTSTALTDAHGKFALEGIAPGSDVTITALHGERITASPTKTQIGKGNVISVTIASSHTIALTGRIVDSSGKSIADAELRVFAQTYRDGMHQGFRQITFEGKRNDLRTDSDGRYRSPKEIDRTDAVFRIVASAEGFHPAETQWIPSTDGPLMTMPNLTLSRIWPSRDLVGRVDDREGKPVEGASVFQSGDGSKQIASKTDLAGKFRLRAIPGGPGFVFAEKAGFRFCGIAVGANENDVKFALIRESEPPAILLHRKIAARSRAEERAIAREILAPFVIKAQAGLLGQANDMTFKSLGRIDPERGINLVENRVVPSSLILCSVILGQYEDDEQSALATIASITVPSIRAGMFLSLYDSVPPTDTERRFRLIEKAIEEARRETSAKAKVHLLGSIADRLLDLDGIERARPLLKEAQALFATLPQDQFAFEWDEFAEILAVIDLPAALDILNRKDRQNASPLDVTSMDRHLGNVARRIAGVRPAEAEGLILGLRPNPSGRTEIVLRTAAAMASKDLPRARKLLDAIKDPGRPDVFDQPAMRPYGLALMAASLAEIEPTQAKELLDESFTELRKPIYGGSNPPVSSLMASLLPLVQRLEPDRLSERVWLAVSCRPHRYDQSSYNINNYNILTCDQALISLALYVSKIDPALAAQLIAPALERFPELLTDNYLIISEIIRAIAAYDDREALALIDRLPTIARPARLSFWNRVDLGSQIRLSVAEMLSIPTNQRTNAAVGTTLGTWPIESFMRPKSTSVRKDAR